MLQQHSQETSVTPPALAVFSQPEKLFLDIRTNSQGRKVLYFPYVSISDIHWGSKFTRAKRLCMALDSIICDRMDGVGDIMGGIEMTKKERFHMGPWHRQGMARMLEKAEQGMVLNIMAGNHETVLRDKIGAGKRIYGVNFLPHTEYTDPKDRRFRVIHGDQYDTAIVQSWYTIGDTLLSAGYEIDHALHKIPLLEKFSVAASGKRLVKSFINKRMGIYTAIADDINSSGFDGLIYGHSHMKGFHVTSAGKLLINDGCCTEHVQFAVHDKFGNWAVIEFHRDRMDVEMENGTEYSVRWADLGLSHFGQDPVLWDDQYTAKADRLLRVAYRLWPPKEKVRLEEEIDIRARQVALRDYLLDKGEDIPNALHWIFYEAAALLPELERRAKEIPIPRRYSEHPPEPLLAIA